MRASKSDKSKMMDGAHAGLGSPRGEMGQWSCARTANVRCDPSVQTGDDLEALAAVEDAHGGPESPGAIPDFLESVLG